MTDHAQRGGASIATAQVDVASLVLILARLCLASEFMTYGVRKFLHPDNISSLIDAHGLPGNLVWLVIPWQVGFGWATFLGFQTRLASVALFGFCIIAPSIFWLDNLENLTRDYGTAGGFIFLFVFGPGRYSIDAQFGRNGRDVVGNMFAWIWENTAVIDRLVVFARALMALPFVADAVKKIIHTGAQQAILQGGGIPAWFVYVLIAGEIVLGLMLLVGFKAKPVAVVLIAWSAVLAFDLHSPAGFLGLHTEPLSTQAWNLFNKNGGTLSSFYKDIEMIGALLMLIIYGPGRISVDANGSKHAT